MGWLQGGGSSAGGEKGYWVFLMDGRWGQSHEGACLGQVSTGKDGGLEASGSVWPIWEEGPVAWARASSPLGAE